MSDAGGRLALREVGEDGLTVHERIVRDLAGCYDSTSFLLAASCLFCDKYGPASPHDDDCVVARALRAELTS